VLAGGDRDPGALENARKLVSRQTSPAFERRRHRTMGALEVPIAKTKAAVHRAIHRMNPRSADGQPWTDVPRRNEVPGWPENMRAQNGPAVERMFNLHVTHAGETHADRPLCPGEVLCLYGAQSSDNALRGPAPRPGEAQPPQAEARHSLEGDASGDHG
jgi:hypothetical protein